MAPHPHNDLHIHLRARRELEAARNSRFLPRMFILFHKSLKIDSGTAHCELHAGPFFSSDHTCWREISTLHEIC